MSALVIIFAMTRAIRAKIAKLKAGKSACGKFRHQIFDADWSRIFP